MKHLVKSINAIIMLGCCCLHLGCDAQNAKHQTNSMKIETISVENNFPGYAYLIPSDWESQASYKLEGFYGISHNLIIDAVNQQKGLKLHAENLHRFHYDEGLAQLRLQMGAPSPPTFQRYEGVENYNQNYVLPLISPAYRVSDMQMMPNFYLKKSNQQTDVLLTAFVSKENQNQIAFLFTVVWYDGFEQAEYWRTAAYFVEGGMNQSDDMFKTAQLVANSIQMNPIYANYIAQINQQIGHQENIERQKLAQIGKNSSDHFFQTFRDMQASSNRVHNSLSEQRSDVMLGLTTFRMRNTGEEVKLPSSNEYYYTNSMNEFLGTNSPLLYNEMNYSSIYNWEELQKKY